MFCHVDGCQFTLVYCITRSCKETRIQKTECILLGCRLCLSSRVIFDRCTCHLHKQIREWKKDHSCKQVKDCMDDRDIYGCCRTIHKLKVNKAVQCIEHDQEYNCTNNVEV